MSILLQKYEEIMTKFKAGEYGNGEFGEGLTMYEILERAGEVDLFERMNETELTYLLNKSTGMTRMMFSYALKALKEREKESSTIKIFKFENPILLNPKQQNAKFCKAVNAKEMAV